MLSLVATLFTLFTMSDQMRDRILSSAVELYLEEGLDGFSMRKLAGQVGVTAPALYRHYDGKEAVLADVVREAYHAHSQYLYKALGAPTPLERFFGAGESYLDFVFEHPRWYAMMNTSVEALGMTSLPEDIEVMGCAIHQFWIDRVRECMDAGILRTGDPVLTSMTLWAHAHGLIDLYHQGKLPMDADQFRSFFEVSGARLMAGVATEAFAAELEERCRLSAITHDDASTAALHDRSREIGARTG